jgi:ribonucleoside-diphosphate reductase alpha chain
METILATTPDGSPLLLTVPAYVKTEDIDLTPNARKVLEKRYLRRDPKTGQTETIGGMFYRVAYTVGHAYGDDPMLVKRYYQMLASKRFFPNSPTFTGASTPLGQLAACFPAGTMISTMDGPRPIEQIGVGNYVLTDKGRYRPVTETMERRDQLYRIEIDKLPDLYVTGEHPFLTAKGWVKAKDLVPKQTFIKVGFTTETAELAPIIHFEGVEIEGMVYQANVDVLQRSGPLSRQVTPVRTGIVVDADLAWLFGLFIAQGSVSGTDIRFTLGLHHQDQAEKVQHLLLHYFGLEATRINTHHEERNANWLTVRTHSKILAGWLIDNFGKGAKGKFLPYWLMTAPAYVQAAFLQGVADGDGTPVNGDQVRIVLVNESLVRQLFELARRLDFYPNLRPAALGKLSTGQPWYVSYGQTYQKHMVQDGCYRVTGVTLTDRVEQVFNFEVEEDHTYVANQVVVHNCFVLKIDDDMGKLPEGIFSTLRNATLIQQTGGGNGFSFGRLRPRGDIVHSSGGAATGPVGFLRVYDKAFGEVCQGGSRRGANMGVLPVHHPDIEEFINCKDKEGDLANFNISVAVTNAFMEAALDGKAFPLINPRNGETVKTVNAADLFDKIVYQAWRNGEPGLLFIDHMNASNPVPHLYTLEATNPCGEQGLGPYENCCLGSINLAAHLTYDADGKLILNWQGLQETIQLATQFLDGVVEVNNYVPAVPQLKEAAFRARRIGLGIMGLADVLFALGVRYGSEEGQELAAQIMEFVRYHAMLTSIQEAMRHGVFEAFEGSIYDASKTGKMQWQPPSPLAPYQRDWGRPELYWENVVTGIKTYGIRNAAQCTVAPTGTISTVAGCEGYGCEPAFALVYTRHFKDGDQDVALEYVSPFFAEALAEADLADERTLALMQEVKRVGSCQQLASLPEPIRQTFVVSGDILPEEHVMMQAALQRFTDNAISKTINFPPDATPDDVANAYKLAWAYGCKGLTVYVTGSRDKVVLETEATKQQKRTAAEPSLPQLDAATGEPVGTPRVDTLVADGKPLSFLGLPIERSRPPYLRGVTYRKATPLGAAYVTVNSDELGGAFEVFLNVGKAGSEVSAFSEALGRLISLTLRMQPHLTPNERLTQIAEQLINIGGRMSYGFGPNKVHSLPDAIGQVLRAHLNTAEPAIQKSFIEFSVAESFGAEGNGHYQPHADLCPDCGDASLLNVEGCRKCISCGYSEC